MLGVHFGAPLQDHGPRKGVWPVRQKFLCRDLLPSSVRYHARRRPRLRFMPGYEPFLLCDFHVHTAWSDGRLTLREVVDLYGQTEKFDVLAITDHILAKKDL